MAEITADKATPAIAPVTAMRTVVAASCAGTAFEWYDFFIFGSLVQIISKNFFAELGATAGLIAALALFGVGFAFRPLGALIFGRIGDRLGRKKLLTGALVLFGIASLACAYASSAGELIAARAALGLAAAVILPLALAVLPVLFTAAERPKAIAIVGGATFLGYPVGPILGGWLLDHFWWGSVFLINVPVVVIAVAAVSWLMPESRGERARVDAETRC